MNEVIYPSGKKIFSASGELQLPVSGQYGLAFKERLESASEGEEIEFNYSPHLKLGFKMREDGKVSNSIRVTDEYVDYRLQYYVDSVTGHIKDVECISKYSL